MARAALRAFDLGDFETARKGLEEAVKSDRRNGALWLRLGFASARLGHVDEAARHLVQALAVKPDLTEAARQLANIVKRYHLDKPADLDPQGLKAALALPGIDHQPVAEVALARWAADAEVAPALVEARRGELGEATRQLVVRRTAECLKSPLLASALAAGLVTEPELETLLANLRRLLLLEVAAERFEDRALFSFALALWRQLELNEYVWAATDEERAKLAALPTDGAQLAAGDVEAGRRLLLGALYAPVATLLSDTGPEAVAGLRPRTLKEAVAPLLKAAADERQIAAGLPRSTGIGNDTSRAVGGHYARHPYPRWSSLEVPPAGSLRAALGRYFAPPRLAFMDGSFDVLVAGAGTGHQAALAALGYGSKARILALDLSAPSLAYGARMTRDLGISNIEFAVGDILDLPALGRRFHVIEAVGVLHHMADPFAGWRALLSVLGEGGIMLAGLYSAIARKPITALRADPAFPGPDAGDDAARALRQRLLHLPSSESGAELRRSIDFHALSTFRDLLLNVHERPVSIPEILGFLAEQGLAFRGFTLPVHVFNHFAHHYPDDSWPGRLESWAEIEETHPRLFDGMYRLWIERGAATSPAT